MAGKFEFYMDQKGEHRFRLKSGNGESILSSEGYSSKASCLKGIASVQANSGDAEKYERKLAKNSKRYINQDHQILSGDTVRHRYST